MQSWGSHRESSRVQRGHMTACSSIDPIVCILVVVDFARTSFRDGDGFVGCLGNFLIIGVGKTQQDCSRLPWPDAGNCVDRGQQ
jgi:hypothetical protein